jgi:hypothetical protein
VLDDLVQLRMWDHKRFNGLYNEVRDNFLLVESISIEGLYHHKTLPNFYQDGMEIPECSKTWIGNTFGAKRNAHHTLAKAIRVNGRLALIDSLVKDLKVVFIIRNPVDVLNSAMQMFSFFGNEFYQSDFPRFIREVNQRWGENFSDNEEHHMRVEREYLFWYYSNLAALEYIADSAKNHLLVVYESFKKNQKQTILEICKFLDLPFKEHYAHNAQRRVGPSKKDNQGLTEKDIDWLSSQRKHYGRLLKDFPGIDLEQIEKSVSYSPQFTTEPSPDFGPFYNPVHLAGQLKELETKYKNLIGSRRYRFINKLLKPLDKIRGNI